jgi:probable rRNA maturation factor
MPHPIGQLIISHQKAKQQANTYGHSFVRELSFLFVHGVLHCLGYDHETPEDEKNMLALQDTILGKRVP